MGSEADDRQIVVASEHLEMVLSLLGERAEDRAQRRSDARLGLTLIQLADVATAVQHLDEERERAGIPAPRYLVEDPTPLDRVLATLREITEARYAGWAPTMGKNRIMTGVQFKPYSNAGGFTQPTKVDKPPAAFRSLSRNHRRVRVGILDTRLEPHSRLAGRCLTDPGALARPRPGQERQWWEGHATFIAGIVLRLAPTADLDVRTALTPGRRPTDGWTMPLWTLAERLADYRDSGVEVLNLSLGCSTVDGKAPMVLERVIAQLTPNMAVICAAGNHGSEKPDGHERAKQGLPARGAPLFPAALDGVLAVGAEDSAGRGASFNPVDMKDPSRPAPWIDVLAPGVEVVSTYLDENGDQKVQVPRDTDGEEFDTVSFGGFANWSGTSFAAAHVTGLVAAEVARGKTPQQALEVVRNRLGRP
ncbi:S8 family peptidase [Geodermatophilus sp. URMC 64]